MAKPTGTPLRILMLHGFTQSGPLFHAKSRALEKHIKKSFPSYSVTLSYPTAPIALNPADIPTFSSANSNGSQADERPEMFAWWRRSNTSDPPEYIGMEKGLAAVARVLVDEGPFDGVIGFSQGAALAAMLASLLEPDRRKAFDYFADPSNNNAQSTPTSVTSGGGKIAAGMSFPSSFAEISHPPLKFAICYGGFMAPGIRYKGFYEKPKIQTPLLHVLGTLDTVVEEERSRKLIEACAGSPEIDNRVLWHPGGHFLPSQRPYLDGAVRFVKGCLEGAEDVQKDGEVSVEDMDMPF